MWGREHRHTAKPGLFGGIGGWQKAESLRAYHQSGEKATRLRAYSQVWGKSNPEKHWWQQRKEDEADAQLCVITHPGLRREEDLGVLLERKPKLSIVSEKCQLLEFFLIHRRAAVP